MSTENWWNFININISKLAVDCTYKFWKVTQYYIVTIFVY